MKQSSQQITDNTTKETFINKLRKYQNYSGVKNNNQIYYGGDFQGTSDTFYKSRQKFKTIENTFNNNVHVQLRQKQLKHKLLYSNIESNHTSLQTCLTKWAHLQRNFQQSLEQHNNSLLITKIKINQAKQNCDDSVKENFKQLQKLEKFIGKTKKQLQNDDSKVYESRSWFSEYTHSCFQILNKRHKQSLLDGLTQIKKINQQSALIKFNFDDENRQSQKQWCQLLDILNHQVISISSSIDEIKKQSDTKFQDMKWKTNQIQLGLIQKLEKEKKQRNQQDSKLHLVLSRLIDRVGLLQ